MPVLIRLYVLYTKENRLVLIGTNVLLAARTRNVCVSYGDYGRAVDPGITNCTTSPKRYFERYAGTLVGLTPRNIRVDLTDGRFTANDRRR